MDRPERDDYGFWRANLATATTVAEAKAAESAGADIIVAQGIEAGGHRGAFDAMQAEAVCSVCCQPL
jgi:NAD(P)H-dependent flavin oxidoreductase YrpB (nitropropane dioxygenase family)